MTTTDSNAAEARSHAEVVAVLARAWTAIRARHDDVPPVVLAVGAHRHSGQRVRLGHFRSTGWSPVYIGEPPEMRALREEFEDAMTRGDLSAALGASARMFAISASQLSEDAKACRSEVDAVDFRRFGAAICV